MSKEIDLPPHPFYLTMDKRKEDRIKELQGNQEDISMTTYTEKTIKERILEGVNILADTVKVTLGAKGKNVLFNDPMTQRPRITKDGVTVAKQVSSDDHIMRMAIEIVREASEKTVKSSGDGTTTTAILAQYLINAGFKLMSEGVSFYDLARQLDEAKVKIIKYIESKSLPIESNFEKLLHVATISANDEEIGRFIYDIVQEIGIYGHIEVKHSHNSVDRITKVKGIKYTRGFYAPQFLSDITRMQWKVNKVYIVLFNDTVRSQKDLDPYIKAVNADEQGKIINNHPILFVVNEVEPFVLQSLINTKLMNPNGFNIMFTEHDGFGDRKIEIMNDIAALTGAVPGTSEDIGAIGFAEEVLVEEDYTSILGGSADTKIVTELIEITKSRLEKDELSDNERLYYKRRLATLAGGVAVIHVGAPTDVEMKERKDRIDDAVEAVKASIDRGISIGGGYALIHAHNEVRDEELNFGESLLYESLLEPFKQLCLNSDIQEEGIRQVITNKHKGYNVINNEFYSLDDYTVYDPTGVLIDSITNAVSVAKSILSIEKAIYNN